MKPLARLTVVLGFSFLTTAHAAQIESFAPQGEVKGVRQITARFSAPMVPFGDPRIVEPFEISCPVPGRARWADGRNWVYDFDYDLPGGIKCEVKLDKNAKTLQGESIEGATTFNFHTGGPSVSTSFPREGDEYIDENQIFILALDTLAQEESITQNVWCSAEGIGERIGVRVINGAKRQELLKQREKFLWDWFRVLYKDARQRYVALKAKGLNGAPLVFVQCQRSLPQATKVNLVWGKGVRAAGSGLATTQDQTLAFRTRPEFTAKFSCDRVNRKAGCVPVLPMSVNFSDPVPIEYAARIQLRDKAGKSYAPVALEDSAKTFDTLRFDGAFPESTEFRLSLPAELRDDSGRKLKNASSFPLTIKTDPYPPLAKFAARFGIIEAKAGAMLPVTMRNIEPVVKARAQSLAADATVPGKTLVLRDDAQVLRWLQRFDQVQYTKGKAGVRSIFARGDAARALNLPKPLGGKEFEVIGIALATPGLHIVELASPKLGAALHGNKKPYYVQSAALVTDLAVHLKWGRESSLAWVTSLDSAQPVADAEVVARDCKGTEHGRGKTDKDGIARFGVLPRELPSCDFMSGLFVSARTKDQYSFALSDWQNGIEPWRFNVPTGSYPGPQIAHTVFDRPLLRAGETVHMKHFLREHTGAGFTIPGSLKRPQGMTITHDGSNQSYPLELRFDANGTAENEWQIPAEAKFGTYSVSCGKNPTYHAGSFRVEAFRVPLMKASMQGPRDPLVAASSAQLDLLVNYLSGGGAPNLPVKLRSQTQPRNVSYADYEDYRFAAGEVKEGIEQSQQLQDEAYVDHGEEDEESEPSSAALPAKATQTIPLRLDANGAARASIDRLPKVETPQDLVVELEYPDPNGELLTAATRVPLWPAAFNLGIKTDGWAMSKDALRVHVVAVDLSGKALPNTEVSVDALQRKHYSHRKRLVGGFYAWEHVSEVKRVGELCKGKTDAKGMLACSGKSSAAGEIILRARAKDAAGRASVTNMSVWVAGKEDWWFDVADHDRMDLLPEKKRYEPGEKARLQVRMPFREATALVSIEREGVLETFVQRLSGKAPAIEVPVRGVHAPNMYVSVLALRGRVGDVQPTALVDLGKPAYKLGIAEINVGWAAHELKVEVKSPREAYRVREKAQIKVSVKRADGGALPKGAEIALAAVDEGLLELAPNPSWKLLDAMMQRRSLEVETATAQMQVVGKRHYGRKAFPHGGGGGRGGARELFETLLLWKGRVALDARGEASIDVPLNDALTAFRIVAVAHGGAGWFGTGSTSIRSTQELSLFGGLPPLVREGDRYFAQFTVRNAGEQRVQGKLQPRLDVQPTQLGAMQALNIIDVDLAPGEAKTVGWDVQVPVGARELQWELAAVDSKEKLLDRLKLKQRVIEAHPVRVWQATLTQLAPNFSAPVALPTDAVPGRGGIHIGLRARLADDMSSVRDYMAQYQYTCIEQLASRALVLRDEAMWQSVMNRLPSYLDRDGLVKYFATDWLQGSDALTAYLLAIAHEAGWGIPDLSRERMLTALQGFVAGRVVRYSALPTADLTLRKLTAIEAMSRYAKATPDMLSSLDIAPNLWPTSGVIDWINILTRMDAIAERDDKLAQATQILRSRLNFQGTSMGFATDRSDTLWWLMLNGDVNAARALLAVLDDDAWREDAPRMARGLLGRQVRGHWHTTNANAWAIVALEKFSDKFESQPVAGNTTASLGQARADIDWRRDASGGSELLPWPPSQQTLEVEHKGSGKPWLTVQSRAAVPLKEAFSSGYKIKRSLSAVEQTKAGQWSRGDVVRVTLELEAQSDMTWVVVADPIPAGSSILGSGLGGDSQVLTRGERRKGAAWPAFEERGFEAFRAYYEFVPKGKWTLEYTLRLNNPGQFELPATRVEAMYAPEMLGEIPNERFVVTQ